MKLEKNAVAEAAGRALFRESDSAHYYTPEGVPRYTQTIKSGPNKGKERSTSLADARKENLFPSITTIHKVKEERMITQYREKHLLKASYENRPKKDEVADDYFDRILQKARHDSLEAARLGSGYHDKFEAILSGNSWDKKDPKLKLVADWIQENVEEVFWTEHVLVDQKIGVAGKADAFVRLKTLGPTLIDWKTRRFKEFKTEPKWRAAWYKSDCRQLAFYGRCIEADEDEIEVANVGMNTKATSPLHIKVWSREEREWANEVVEAVNILWQHENNFRPELKELKDDSGVIISSELLNNAKSEVVNSHLRLATPLDRVRLINTRLASELFSSGLATDTPKGESWDALVTYYDGRQEYYELAMPTKEEAVNDLRRRDIV